VIKSIFFTFYQTYTCGLAI